MDSTERVINLPIPDGSDDYYFARAMVIEKGEPYFYGCAIPVIDPAPRTGHIAIEPSQGTYRSGENVRIAVHVLDDLAKGHPCSIAVSIYNANPKMETDSEGRAIIEFPMPAGVKEWKISAWAIHTNFAATGETTLSGND